MATTLAGMDSILFTALVMALTVSICGALFLWAVWYQKQQDSRVKVRIRDEEPRRRR